MPDPRQDLADIVEPALAAAPAQPDFPAALALGALLLAALLIAAGYWRWRRTETRRRLRQLAESADIPAAAAELARLRLRPADDAWQAELDRLRFALPRPDAAATLARLCRQAEAGLN